MNISGGLSSLNTADPSSSGGVVSTGLLLHLDAGNAASYPGSGSTWSNLISGSMNGTLGAGVTYSASNGGSMVFNGGGTALVTVPSANAVTGLTNNTTIEAWYSSSNNHPIILATGSGSNGVCFGYFSSNPTSWKVTKYGVIDLFVGSIPQNTAWHQVVVVYSSTAGVTVYIDGVSSGNTANTSNISPSSSQQINIGALESVYHNGSIGIVRWYNTALSASDVAQNFAANRSRYGI